MRLSTKGQYGVRAMLDLALRYGDGPIPLKSIAERENLSEHYLEQLIAPLRKAGLVESVRGAQGGYQLACAPDKVRIGDIIRVLEGPIAPVECVDETRDDHGGCERVGICVSRTLWRRLRDAISKVLDETTLADLVEEAEAMRDSDDFMYYI